MNKDNKLIPELRFPEFKDSGEWEVKPLSDLLEYERPDKYIVTDTNYKNDGIPVLTANKSFILGFTDENFGIYDKQSAIIFDDFTVDNKYVNFPFKVKSSAIKILTPKGKDDLKFIYELMSQIKFDAIQHKRYYISQYQNLKVPIPKPAEQQKIASCLSSLDELLEAHKQKLELLKTHKKGLMQNLFPQEGEKVPKLRFPEFKDSVEWEEIVLNNFIKERKEISNENNPLYSLTIEDGITPKSERYERSFLVKNKKEAYKILYPYDFAYNPMNLRFGAIALYRGKTKVALSKYYNIFYCDDSVDPRFCEFYFKSNQMLTLYDDVATGSLIEKRRVHFSVFLKLEIPFPKKKEQQKIAECLSSIDELITAEAEKIEQLGKHKKGLIQGLFPEIN